MAAAEEKRRLAQAEETLRLKREEEARLALRLREQEDARLKDQRDATQATMASKQRPAPTVVLASVPAADDRKQHPMVLRKVPDSTLLARFHK